VPDSVLQPIDHYTHAHWPAGLQDRQLVIIELVQDELARASGRVLDIGCGNGFFLAELDRRHDLRARGWELTGVDYSPAVLVEARQHPYAFERCNLEEGIPFPDASFDIVTASELIEHIYNPDHLLSEIHRILRPGGRAVLTTPNLQAWYNRALFVAGVQPIFYETSTKSSAIGAGPLRRFKAEEAPVGHMRVFNRRALLDIVASEGLRTVALRGATFERITGAPAVLDRWLTRWPSLASNLVIALARD
jgi:methionine biosynthesis protein MetW